MIDKNLFGFAGVRQRMGSLALLSLIQALCIVGQAYGLTRGLVEIWNLHSVSSLVGPIAQFIVFYLARHLCDIAKQRISSRWGKEVTAQIRPRLQQKIYRLGPQLLAQRGTGSAVTMLIEGLDQVKSYIEILLPKMTDMMLISPVILIAVWWEDWVSGLILLLMYPLIIFFMVILGLAARDRSNKQYAQFNMLNTRFVDSILGLPTLKMLGVDKKYEDEIYNVSERFRKRTIDVLKVAMTSTFALDWFTTLSIAIVAVFLGLRLVNGTMPLFPAMFALVMAPDYYLPVRQFGDNYHATLDGKNAMHDIMSLVDGPETPQDTETEWDGWSAESELKLNNVDFAYPEDSAPAEGDGAESMAGHNVAINAVEQQQKPNQDDSEEDQIRFGRDALHHVSVDFKGYRKVAVIGKSGAGKSTLVNLLAGFNVPHEGSIELDGRAMNHLNVQAWQRHISYIQQTPYIFSGSIADNIRFYVNGASEEAVKAAAHNAGLDQWLEQLSDGLETRIGEGNRGISGGQAQRIALARVLLDKSREVLIFDEPTAHLDIETEYELKKTLLPIMENHLVILATHRLHWLGNMDQVLVLEQGKVVESGAPADLIGAGGALDGLISEMGGNQIDRYLD
ncbi:ATP-binding cassette subfamily C protein CydD [Bifidobacterium commune]|uniref:ATP-binding cassette, subfamily C, CydD n=1 Tax=Bifidobacterium commune TaxID=1505727 RepID=A0A1C4H3T7_9BIFI|nr:ABC transporter ATP-binding protein/permease [Bifidobacterium commune]MBB2955095.1 ATP-binding cassette subfamily C protein CydD [Bifidobacterium commune]SCC79441.1 ATP-binding cassette, subfamily C, CydD [Bifidobacterium commune]